MEETELSIGLYPVPPAFSEAPVGIPAHQFWVIKHGIKASGMPAWGKSMEDNYIWGMVAFLQRLPELDPDGYQALITSSGGHSHGGGESGALDPAEDLSVEGGVMHTHADGTREMHPAPAADQPTESTIKKSPPAGHGDDGHPH